MKLGIFGRLTERTDLEAMARFFAFLREKGVEYAVHPEYANELQPVLPSWAEDVAPLQLSGEPQALRECHFAYSFGGDGTFLNTVRHVGQELPVLGINFGRLGFLTSVTQENLIGATEELMKDMYRIELRNGISVESNPDGLFKSTFGLNDLTLAKAQSNEMITVHTYINGEFLNSYWGDGLIIATPTGSTAYNLACGGPIIHPAANSVAITPVAPHSLTVRPMILPDDYVISFTIESRTGKAMVALDTLTVLVDTNVELAVRKSDKPVKLVRVQSSNYLDSLRDRLMWGHDSRNWKERMGKTQ